MVESFKCKESQKIFNGEYSGKFPRDIHKRAQRKLLMLHAALNLVDLQVPPENMLEKLKGRRKGKYSIRVNDKWRICFSWNVGNVSDVEIADYHK